MNRAASSTQRRRRVTLLSAAAAAAAATALVATASTTGAAADIIARPPFFVPQRADNLILSGGRDAGDWESLHALADAGLPCYGNMCESKSAASSGSSRSSAMDNPGAVQKNSPASRNVDQSYVGHSQPIGSSVEGGAFDSQGRLADPAATLSATINPAAHGGGGSMFAGVGSAAAQEVAASFSNANGGGAKLAWDPAKSAATTTTTATAATAATATAAPAAAAAAPATAAAAPASSSSSPTTTSTSSTMETLAAVERAPTTAFPTAGKKATTPAGGVAFATGEHEYLRGEKAIDESLDDALDNAKSSESSNLRLPPAPRGPAGKAAAALVGAAQGAAERVAGAASTGVNAEGQPPADDAEAFSMAVANAAGKVAKRLGEVAAAGAGGGGGGRA